MNRTRRFDKLAEEEINDIIDRRVAATVEKRLNQRMDRGMKEIQGIVGMRGAVTSLQSGPVKIDGEITVSDGGTNKSRIEEDGDVLFGSDVGDPATTSFVSFAVAQSYNGEDFEAGDLLIGDNSDGKANVRWDALNGRLDFRIGQTVTAYMDTDGVFEVESGTIGGWTIGAASIAAGNITLDSSIPALKVGAATDYLTGAGIFAGLSGGAYKFHIGNPAGNYLAWDGTNLKASGQWITSAGMNPTLQKWTTTVLFSSASATQVNWAAGVIRLSDGTVYNITAGNTGAMAALTYIYLDVAVSATVLQTTTTYSNAVGDGKVLVAAAQNNATGASVIPFGGQQPILDGASALVALSVTAGQIAAATITADKLSVESLSAVSASMGDLTIDGALTAAGGNFVISPTSIDIAGLVLAIKNAATNNGVSVNFYQGMRALGTNPPDYTMEYRGTPAGSELVDGNWTATTGTIYENTVYAATSPVGAKSTTRFAVTAGAKYNVIGALSVSFITSVNNELGAGSATLVIKWYDASSGGTLKGTDTITNLGFSGRTALDVHLAPGFYYYGTSWQNAVRTLSAPSGATYAEIDIDASLSTTPAHLLQFTALWDSVSVMAAGIASSICFNNDGRIIAANITGGGLLEEIFKDTAVHAIDGSAAETTLTTFTVPANVLYVDGQDRGIRVRFKCEFYQEASGGSRTETINWYWGGNLLFTRTSPSLAPNQKAFIHEELVIKARGAANVQRACIVHTEDSGADGTGLSAPSAGPLVGHNAATVDTTSTAALVVKAQHSNAHAAIHTRMVYFIAEYI